jgi:hypothetical protein
VAPGQTILDDFFEKLALAPGNYLLFAIADGWQLRWRQK